MPRKYLWDAVSVVASGFMAVANGVLSIGAGWTVAYVILVAAGVLAMAVVRRFPLTVFTFEATLFIAAWAWAPIATGALLVFGGIALALVAYLHRWPVTAAAMTGAFVVEVLLVSSTGLTSLDIPTALRIAMLAMTVISPVMLGRHLRSLRYTAELATARAEDAEHRRQAEADKARLTERTRLAGDLHDIVAHHVSAIALRAGSGHYAATHASDPQTRLDEAVLALQTIRDDAQQTLAELRGLLRVLRDPLHDGLPTQPDTMITDAVARTRSAGLNVEARIDDRVAGAPADVRITAARTVQEALTNALKHAGPGADVLAVVRIDDAMLRVEVTDSGAVGNRPALPASGHGIAGIRDRITEAGGTMSAGPTDHGGWHLSVALPLGAAA